MFDMKMDLHTHPPANTTTQFPSQGASYQSMMLPKQQHQNLNPTGGGGGGHISPPVFQKIIALEPNVGLTSDQAVNSSLSVVLRCNKN